MELQLRNGCYDFLPVLNLMLLAVPTVAEVSKRLNFPSLTSKFLTVVLRNRANIHFIVLLDELIKLNQLEESVRSGTPLAKQLHQKWITMVSLYCFVKFKRKCISILIEPN